MKKLYISIAIISILTACTKITEGDKQNKQGTFQVYIEGFLDLQLNIQGSCTHVFADYMDFPDQGLVNTKSLLIEGFDDKNRLIGITLYFTSLPLDGVFHLGLDDINEQYGGMGQYKPDATNITSIFYSTDDKNTGTCTITAYNKSTQTISGTFDFIGQARDNSGAVLAGMVAHFTGSFNDVPINDLTDPDNPKGVCFGNTGNQLGTGGSNTDGGENNNQVSTITFINPAFTPIEINFNGETKTAPVGGNAKFSGTPNVTQAGKAVTSGKTSSGTQVGLLIQWDNLSVKFPSAGTNLDYNLNVENDIFFLRIINNSAYTIQKVYVNYSLSAQSLDNISLLNDGKTYGLGYYNAFSNSNVRAESGTYSWTWNTLNLSTKINQSITLSAQ